MTSHNIDAVLGALGEMEFATIAPFNDGHVGAFWSSSPGESDAATSPWEMHPDTDELLMCVDGSVEVQILDREAGNVPLETDLVRTVMKSGEFVVVPKGQWHRHYATTAFKEFYLTPGRSEHSMAVDPRSPES